MVLQHARTGGAGLPATASTNPLPSHALYPPRTPASRSRSATARMANTTASPPAVAVALQRLEPQVSPRCPTSDPLPPEPPRGAILLRGGLETERSKVHEGSANKGAVGPHGEATRSGNELETTQASTLIDVPASGRFHPPA